ncbi:MAG: YceD family protein [Pseudomonadales bacterium]
MSTGGLTRQAEIRKLAAHNAIIQGELKAAELARFAKALTDDGGIISYRLAVRYNEEYRPLIEGTVSARVTVQCQRCLEPMEVDLASDLTWRVVWTDEQAKHLDRDIEPLIAPEGIVDLLAALEDELLLCLPYVSYHEPSECNEKEVYISGEIASEETESNDQANPFKLLESLKKT